MSDYLRLVVGIDAETQAFQKGMAEVEQSLVKTKKRAEETSASMKKIGGGTATKGMNDLQMQIKNTSYQFQDFIVQVTGGQDAFRALGQQLPQLLSGFGALGAVIGVVATLIPVAVTAWKALQKETIAIKDANEIAAKSFTDLVKPLEEVNRFSFDNIVKSYSEADAATRELILSNLELNVALSRVAAVDLKTALVDNVNQALKQIGFLNAAWAEFQVSIEKSKAAEAAGDRSVFQIKPSDLETFAKATGLSKEQAAEIQRLTDAYDTNAISAKQFATEFNKLAASVTNPNKEFREYAKTINDAALQQIKLSNAIDESERAQKRLKDGNYSTKDSIAKTNKELEAQQKALEKLQESQRKQADAIIAGIDPYYAYELKLKELNILLEAQALSWDRYADAVFDAQDKLDKSINGSADKTKGVLQQIQAAMDGFARDFTNTLVDSLREGEFEFKKFAENVIATIAKIMINQQVVKFLTAFGAYGGNSGPVLLGGGDSNVRSAPSSDSSTRSLVTPMTSSISSPTVYSTGSKSATVVGAPVNINVNNETNSNIEVSETTSSDGSRNIEIMVKEQIKSTFASGGMDRTMRSLYGVSRRGA